MCRYMGLCWNVRQLHCHHWHAGRIRMAGHFTAGFVWIQSVASALKERSHTCSGQWQQVSFSASEVCYNYNKCKKQSGYRRCSYTAKAAKICCWVKFVMYCFINTVPAGLCGAWLRYSYLILYHVDMGFCGTWLTCAIACRITGYRRLQC